MICIKADDDQQACGQIRDVLNAMRAQGWRTSNAVALRDGRCNEYELTRASESMRLDFDLGPNLKNINPVVFAALSMALCAEQQSNGSTASRPLPPPPQDDVKQSETRPKRLHWLLRILKWTGIAFAILILAGIVLGFWAYHKDQTEATAAKQRIDRTEVELSDLTLKRNYSLWALNGRVKNLSPKYNLTGLTLKITMKDILPDGTSEIVGEETEYVSCLVPPNQIRELSSYVSLRDLGAARGRFEWNYEIVEVRGKEPVAQ